MEFASSLEELLWDHFILTGKHGTVVHSTDKVGCQAFWIEPRVPDQAYTALTWHLTPDKLMCQMVELNAFVTLPR